MGSRSFLMARRAAERRLGARAGDGAAFAARLRRAARRRGEQ
jgi:hypothetical protein